MGVHQLCTGTRVPGAKLAPLKIGGNRDFSQHTAGWSAVGRRGGRSWLRLCVTSSAGTVFLSFKSMK